MLLDVTPSKIGAGLPRVVAGFESRARCRYEVYLPVVLAKNLLATIHSKCGTFHADGPYDLLRLLRCDLRFSFSPSAPKGRSGTTGAYLWSQV